MWRGKMSKIQLNFIFCNDSNSSFNFYSSELIRLSLWILERKCQIFLSDLVTSQRLFLVVITIWRRPLKWSRFLSLVMKTNRSHWVLWVELVRDNWWTSRLEPHKWDYYWETGTLKLCQIKLSWWPLKLLNSSKNKFTTNIYVYAHHIRIFSFFLKKFIAKSKWNYTI